MSKFSMVIKTLVLLAATIGSAQAATINLGNLYEKSVVIGQTYGKGTVFSDDYIFDIMPISSYAGIVTSINLDPYFSVSGLTVSLSGNGMAPIVRTLGIGETTIKLDSITLASGMGYDFNVSGIASGSLGGAYAGVLAAAAPIPGAVATAPVPVPAAAWLMVSGLIGLAGFARKSK
jgi:hypothetical protein